MPVRTRAFGSVTTGYAEVSENDCLIGDLVQTGRSRMTYDRYRESRESRADNLVSPGSMGGLEMPDVRGVLLP